jgi:hypothetical protein
LRVIGEHGVIAGIKQHYEKATDQGVLELPLESSRMWDGFRGYGQPSPRVPLKDVCETFAAVSGSEAICCCGLGSQDCGEIDPEHCNGSDFPPPVRTSWTVVDAQATGRSLAGKGSLVVFVSKSDDWPD